MGKEHLLHQLKDIHYPKPIGFWPLATGWWLLFLFMIVAGVGLYYAWKNWRRHQFKQQFLHELQSIQKQYQQDSDGQKALSQLALLLKRVALNYYPREQVASLHGQEWLDFLQSTGMRDDKEQIQGLFTASLYQAKVVSDVNIAFRFAKQWIKKQSSPCMN